MGQVRFFLLWCKFFLLLFIFFFSCMKKMLSQEYSFSVLNRMKNKHLHDFFVCKTTERAFVLTDLFLNFYTCVTEWEKLWAGKKKVFPNAYCPSGPP